MCVVAGACSGVSTVPSGKFMNGFLDFPQTSGWSPNSPSAPSPPFFCSLS